VALPESEMRGALDAVPQALFVKSVQCFLHIQRGSNCSVGIVFVGDW